MTAKRKRLKPTAKDGMVALRDHVLARAQLAHERYGSDMGLDGLERLLADSDVVRYPCGIVVDGDALEPGELAFARQRGEKAADGFDVVVHPNFACDHAALPVIVMYQLVVVNYGGIATEEEAELFGATVLGMDKEDYYRKLCALADSLAG